LNPTGLSCLLPTDSLNTDTSTASVGGVDPPTCVTTTRVQDGHPLTALLVDPTFVTGVVDAAHVCDIGVYYSPGGPGGTVSGAEVENANYYGVVDDNAAGPVYINSDTKIHDIGDATFNGSQHGVGIFYTGDQNLGTVTGTVDGNEVYLYQKNGMAIKNGADVRVTNNTVTGRGPQKIIAQNGIEFLYATSPELTGNVVSMNIYTQNTSCTPDCVGSTTGVTSTGFLLFHTNFKNPGAVAPYNHAYRNQVNYYVVNR
jgi:hypothetical protein